MRFVVVFALAAATATSDAPVTLRALFPSEAPIELERPGIARLSLPPEVIAACRPDLSDLRIVDAAGKEVAFLVDGGLDPGAATELVDALEPKVLDVRREEVRRETGPPLHRETYIIPAPPFDAARGPWRLHLRTAKTGFVKRARIVALPDGGDPVPLVEETSFFRLAAGATTRAEKLSLVLPPFNAPRLEVTLEGEDGSFLEPALGFEQSRLFGGAEQMVVPLAERSRKMERGRTVVELDRPPGLVADALRLRTSTTWFDRGILVQDQRRDRRFAAVGGGNVFRLQALTAVEALEVPLRRAGGDRLRVEIFDGDSPPLEDLVFFAVVRQPALLFAARRDETGALTLLFGGGRAFAPRYDVAGLLPESGRELRGDRAIAAARLRDPSLRVRAVLGAIRENPVFDRTPALAYAMRPGAAVDPRAYRHRRVLTVGASPEGVTRLRLSAEDLAVARADLADVRLVDAESRQWPYLVETDEAEERVALGVSPPERDGQETVHRVTLPVAALRLDEIALETPAAFVDRPYRVVARVAGSDRGESVAIGRGRLVRRSRDVAPLVISFPPVRVDSLELRVEDGSESPLELTGVRARVPIPELLLTAEPGEYSLLLGKPDDAPPRYEIEAVRDVVAAVATAPVAPGALGANPDYSVRARLATAEGIQTVSLWIVLAAAVVVLGALTLRLTRRDAPSTGS